MNNRSSSFELHQYSRLTSYRSDSYSMLFATTSVHNCFLNLVNELSLISAAFSSLDYVPWREVRGRSARSFLDQRLVLEPINEWVVANFYTDESYNINLFTRRIANNTWNYEEDKKTSELGTHSLILSLGLLYYSKSLPLAVFSRL